MIIYKKSQGFTLIELLVAIGIMGLISVVSMRSLYDIVTIRAKQQSIEETSDTYRSFIRQLTQSVLEAENVYIPNSGEIRVVGRSSCQTIKFDPVGFAILQKVTDSYPCTPPESDLVNITDSNLRITKLEFSPVGGTNQIVTFEVAGIYKNALGDHEFNYKTTITPRV